MCGRCREAASHSHRHDVSPARLHLLLSASPRHLSQTRPAGTQPSWAQARPGQLNAAGEKPTDTLIVFPLSPPLCCPTVTPCPLPTKTPTLIFVRISSSPPQTPNTSPSPLSNKMCFLFH